jgi:thioredoxin 1
MKKVYKFSASWCGPCKTLTKTLSTIESSAEIEEVDIDLNPDLTRQYNIRGVPTLVLIEDDIELKRKVGVMTGPEFLSWIET